MDSTEALRCCSNAAEADRGRFCGGHENRENREVDGQTVPHQGGVGKGHAVEINTKVKVDRRRKGLGESSDDELVLLSTDSDSDSEGIATIGEDFSSHTKDPDGTRKYQGASMKVGNEEHLEHAENSQEKQNATTPTAETLANLPGVETAEDRQRILGPLSNLVFPFFDVIFPRALLERTLEKNKIKYNSRHVQAFGGGKDPPQDVYTVDHLYGLLGIVVLMGCIDVKRLDLYWSNRPQYYFPELRDCMPRNTFWRLFTRLFRQIGTSDRIKAGQRGYRSNHHTRKKAMIIEESAPPPRLTHMKFTGQEDIASQKIRSYVTDRKLYQAMVNAHRLFVSWCKIRLVQANEQLDQLKKDEPTRGTAEKLRSLEEVSNKLDKLSRKDRLGWDMALSSAMMAKCGGCHVKRAKGGRGGKNPPSAVPSGPGVWIPTAYSGTAPCFNQERLTAVDIICVFPQGNCQCKRCTPYSSRFCVKSTRGGCCCKACTTKEGKTRTRICQQCCANPESHMRAYNFAWLKTLKGSYTKRKEVAVPDRLLREGVLAYKRKPEQQSRGKRSKAKSDT